MLVYSCSKSNEQNYLAMVGAKKISAPEFSSRYNFNPYLSKMKDGQEARKALLASLIAEKLLSLQAEAKGIETQDIENLIVSHQREAMIEELRRDSVEKEIQISKEELQEEYERSLKVWTVSVYGFGSLPEAQRARRELVRKSPAGRQSPGQAPTKFKVLQKELNWPLSNPQLENALYKLKLHEVSPPLAEKGKYYLIMLQSVKNRNLPKAGDFRQRRSALEDHVLRRKIREKYAAFFYRHIEARMGKLNRKAVERALNLLAEQLSFGHASPSAPFANFKSLPDEVDLSGRDMQPELAAALSVTFPSGQKWTTKKLFSYLKNGPYAFDYSDKASFIRSFRRNINLLLEHQAVYEMAREQGYADKEAVSQDAAMWADYYRASSFRYNLLKQFDKPDSQASGQNKKFGLTRVQEERLDFMDGYLSNLLDKYEIEINNRMFRELKLHKLDMLMMKSHFAQRLAAPVTEPLGGMPRWQKKINNLFEKFAIN